MDFSSRSVITPGQGLDIHEVGVPVYVAKTQTFADKVTRYNIKELQQRVINGPDHIFGAHSVIDKSGSQINLGMCKQRAYPALELGWTVNRTLVSVWPLPLQA